MLVFSGIRTALTHELTVPFDVPGTQPVPTTSALLELVKFESLLNALEILLREQTQSVGFGLLATSVGELQQG